MLREPGVFHPPGDHPATQEHDPIPKQPILEFHVSIPFSIALYLALAPAEEVPARTLPPTIPQEEDSLPVVGNVSPGMDSVEALDTVAVRGRRRVVPPSSEQAARMPLRNLENPQAYSVVTSGAIAKKGATTFSDAIRTVPGIVSEGYQPGVRAWPQLRGFTDQAFFRNGKMLGSWTENDIANIERVEVLKGPSGALFGGHGRASYGGVINRVTKTPQAGFGGEAQLVAGGDGYNRAAIDLNVPVDDEGKALSRVNAAYRKEDSFQDYGWGESFFFAPVLTYQASDRLKLLVEAEFFKVDAAVAAHWSPTAGVDDFDQLDFLRGRSFLTDEIASNHQTVYFNADAEYALGAHWKSTTSYAFSHSDYDYQSLMSGIDLVRDSVDRMAGRYVYDIDFTNVQQNFTGDFHVGPVRNRVVVGFDYLRDSERYSGTSASLASFATSSIAPYVSYQDYLAALAGTPAWAGGALDERYSAYVSDVVSPLPVLHLMASARYEYAVMSSPSPTIPGEDDPEFSFEQGAWTPKVGVVYEVLPGRLSMFGNYMGSTRNENRLRVDSNVSVKAEPERATQFEGGLKADLFDGRFGGTISAFDITVSDKIRSNPSRPGFSLQDGTQVHRGLELDLFALPVRGLELTAGYARLDATFENGANAGKQVSGAPENSAKYWASYTLPSGPAEGLGIGVGGDYRSDAYYDDANTIVVPGAHLVNASVSFTQIGYRLAVQVDNVADVVHWGVAGALQPGRTVKTSATIRF